MKLQLYCEGNWDGRVDRRGQCEGAAVVILRRLLTEAKDDGDDEPDIQCRRLPKLTRGGGLRRKVELVIAEAEDDERVDSLVVLVDRDKPEYKSRLGDMESALARMEGKAIASRVVVGMAVEELEAWLIADDTVLTRVFGAVQGIPKPENRKDPKADFHEILDAARVDRTEGYDRAAGAMNFKTVGERCKAFARFARDVQDKLVKSGSG